MNLFAPQRFLRVFVNDLILLRGRRIAMVTLALMGLGLLVYFLSFSAASAAPNAQPLWILLFPVLLLGAGLVFTSVIYGDMHHPLERFHYLTLPCSNLERFISRYLITAPLFYLYALVFYFVLDFVARALMSALFELTLPPFDLGNQFVREFSIIYFAAHAVMYTGAIYFRSYALIRTGASLFGLWLGCIALMFVSVRILYADQFVSFLQPKPEFYIDIQPPAFFRAMEDGWEWTHKLLAFALVVWVLFLGYLGLRHYEVKDGL
jgi:hypothetical protein